MQGKTHIYGGVCLALLLTETGIYNTGGSVSDVGIMLLTAGIGSLLPDIDTKTSTISHKHKVVSFFSRLFFTHRGFTHSLTAWVILSLVLAVLAILIPCVMPAALGISIGYLSHIVLDMFNYAGVPLFYPMDLKISIGKSKSGGLLDKIICIVMFGVAVCLLFMHFQPYMSLIVSQIMDLKEKLVNIFGM